MVFDSVFFLSVQDSHIFYLAFFSLLISKYFVYVLMLKQLLWFCIIWSSMLDGLWDFILKFLRSFVLVFTLLRCVSSLYSHKH